MTRVVHGGFPMFRIEWQRGFHYRCEFCFRHISDSISKMVEHVKREHVFEYLDIQEQIRYAEPDDDVSEVASGWPRVLSLREEDAYRKLPALEDELGGELLYPDPTPYTIGVLIGRRRKIRHFARRIS